MKKLTKLVIRLALNLKTIALLYIFRLISLNHTLFGKVQKYYTSKIKKG